MWVSHVAWFGHLEFQAVSSLVSHRASFFTMVAMKKAMKKAAAHFAPAAHPAMKKAVKAKAINPIKKWKMVQWRRQWRQRPKGDEESDEGHEGDEEGDKGHEEGHECHQGKGDQGVCHVVHFEFFGDAACFAHFGHFWGIFLNKCDTISILCEVFQAFLCSFHLSTKKNSAINKRVVLSWMKAHMLLRVLCGKSHML